MDSKIIDFILSKLKIFIIVSIFLATITVIAFGLDMGMNYYLGFFIGVLNFIALSVGSSRVLEKSSSRGKRNGFEQFLFFVFRYFIVAALLVLSIKYLNANVFALILGLLTIHISLIIPVIPNFIGKRKGG